MSSNTILVIASLIAIVVPDQIYNPELKELKNGVLVMDEGFVLQGGGSAHALIKLNVSKLKLEVNKSCRGAKMLSEFVTTYDRDKKGYVVFKDVKSLVDTIDDLCSYIDLQIYNLEKTFKLCVPLNDKNDRIKKGKLDQF